MKNRIFSLKLVALAAVMLFAYSCEENEYEDVGVAEGISFNAIRANVVIGSNEETYELKVQSTTTSNTDRTFSFQVVEENADGVETTASPDTYSSNNQVTIPAGQLIGSTVVGFTIDDLAYSVPQNVVFELVEGDYTINSTRKFFVLSFERSCPLNLVELKITTDPWPEETTWEIYDLDVSTSEPILSGGPLTGLGEQVVTIPLCLDSGNYGVVIRDEYGDGIVGGGYAVVLNGVTLTSGVVSSAAASSTFTID